MREAFGANYTAVRARAIIPARLSNGSLAIPCNLRDFGVGWGAHKLCAAAPPSTPSPPLPGQVLKNAEAVEKHPARCTFYSFGISRDFSFDVALAKHANCSGFAFDPTVVYPALLHQRPPVLFHYVGANSLEEHVNSRWPAVTSVPAFRRWQRHGVIAVLKMDCEGCEYALARDVLREDPEFFKHVTQFAVEIHVSRRWIRSALHATYLGHLFSLLDEAGLALRHVFLSRCRQAYEDLGCGEALTELGYPCGPTIMCQNLLFAR